eukprot:CAMPEP_0177608598 /NCGR_PEP_ID=MMETSP0419_2-20121207/18562_1 /TAXON_ID=582737 /ORGANISM="Tetraselmis sp., Strain GSL018" /LENGTH=224 /DNA_ID=CAMNT_0019103309 /DNA_START=179 /DNA_END=848 /DNA_ORIENTATION=+
MQASLRVQDQKLIGAHFEVFGKVQGVYFRKYTKQEADRLGVVGWVMNTKQGTVVGEIQGERDSVLSMMDWLKSKGSPASVIKKAAFKENWYLPHLRYSKFSIVTKPPQKGQQGDPEEEISYLQPPAGDGELVKETDKLAPAAAAAEQGEGPVAAPDQAAQAQAEKPGAAVTATHAPQGTRAGASPPQGTAGIFTPPIGPLPEGRRRALRSCAPSSLQIPTRAGG